MNLHSKKYLFLFFILIFSGGEFFAQQSGYAIKNYPPTLYGGFSQTWQSVQDKNGLLFFAGTTSVFIYDGESWDYVHVKTGAANRQIVFDSTSSTIYVGAVSEFGYLKRTFNGKWQFISLLSKVPAAYRVFADIWKIYTINGNVYFQASERIFVFRDNNFVNCILPHEGKTFALSFCINNHLYVRERTTGLCEVVNNKLVSLPGGEVFADMRLLGMLPWTDGSTLILSGDEGFYRMTKTVNPKTNSRFEKFTQASDTFLLHAGVLGCKWVNDSSFAIYSRQGIGFYNNKAQLKTVINKATGMIDESISELYVDREQNIWATTNNGFAKISYNSPSLIYTSNSGFKGSMEMLLIKNKTIYLATSEGIFTAATNSDSSGSMKFSKVNFESSEIWDLSSINDKIYGCTSEGLIKLKPNGEVVALNDHYTNRIVPTPIEGELVSAEKGGVSFMKTDKEGNLTYSKFKEFPGEEMLRVSPVDTVKGNPLLRDFWCETRFRSVLHIQMNIETGESTVHRYDTLNNLMLLDHFMVKLGDSVYFVNANACYRYLPSKDTGPGSKCFAEAPGIYERLHSGNLDQVKLPFDFRLFIQKPGEHYVTIFGTSPTNKITRASFLPNDFDESTIQFSFAESPQSLWTLSNEYLVHIHPSAGNNTGRFYNAIISNVKIGNDSTIFYGSDSLLVVNDSAFMYHFNSVTFHFAAPFFYHEDQIQFSYKLEGYDTAWSKYTDASKKEYTNLSEGTYTFCVRSRNTFFTESRIARYTFTILPPWYRTTWAYLIYIICFIGSLFISVRLGANRLRKQKEKLEKIVTERTAEIVEQNHKIEAQNFELESAYKGIQDSIHYAERIQHAILPVASEIYNSFPDSFVFFRPRDIVSGDFYWFVKRNHLTWIACVDCTGHGVPGAFMSMIGNTLLNEIVLEKNIEAPDKILNLLHLRIRQALRQDVGGETRDGMDIALCLIDEQKKKLFYAGANRAMWLMRKKELHIFSPDKSSIGGTQGAEERVFTLHETDLIPDDCVYLSSDGYADQFGGPKGKKFMVKRFQGLLKEIHTLPMNEQHDILEKTFLEWKGKLEQVDDVLVIGFRYIITQ